MKSITGAALTSFLRRSLMSSAMTSSPPPSPPASVAVPLAAAFELEVDCLGGRLRVPTPLCFSTADFNSAGSAPETCWRTVSPFRKRK